MLKKWQISALESIEGWDEFLNEESSSAKNKKLLLEMARNGEPRPKKNKHPLGSVLTAYTGKMRDCYDPVFDKQIRELAPHWFIAVVEENKRLLLEMAKKGKPRPKQGKHPLGGKLSDYTNGIHRGSKFDKQIRRLAPHWFVEQTIEQKKQQLLEMARNGEPRPSQRKYPSLGSALSRYTDKNKSYDPDFDREIRKLAPHWFVDAAENKKLLLEMARNGEPRPSKEIPLGRIINYYFRCDPDFYKKIKELAPHWFDRKSHKQSKIAKQKKQQLLEMARNGEPRPKRKKHKLGISLGCYTSKNNSSYDPAFDKQIRKLAPHWFRKNHA